MLIRFDSPLPGAQRTLTGISLVLGLFVACGSAVAGAHDFVIHGAFVCTSQGITMPVEGAVVGILRDKTAAADPIVTEVATQADGSFTVRISAKNIDSYYAKLFLNDKQGVFLRDWWTLSVREYNSAKRGRNKTADIDLGITEITRDRGKGTPECAVWQGGRRAWQDYVHATGQRPLIGEHGNYQIVMESTASGIVWTSRDTTHWEMGYPTGEFSRVQPVADPQSLSDDDLFQFYGTNVHEFGHALRHTADGSEDHFEWDATRFFYGHSHDLCKSAPLRIDSNLGYGFNEGWADYWQGTDPGSLDWCFSHGIAPTNFEQESAVAADLQLMEDSLGPCANLSANIHGDQLRRQRRHLMFSTLAGAGHEKVHSDQDFRDAWARRFPACRLPAPGTRLALTVRPDIRALMEPQATGQTAAGAAAGAANRMSLHAADLARRLDAADHGASLAATMATPEDTQAARALPIALRARIDLARLAALHLAGASADTPQVLMTAQGQAKRAADATAFDRDARAVVLRMLTEQRALLAARHQPSDGEDLAAVDAQIQRVNAGSDEATAALLNEAMMAANGEEVRERLPGQ